MEAIEIKKMVGYEAAESLVKSDMKIGMGTGSTAVWAIRKIGEMQRKGEIQGILAVVTSFQSMMECEAQKIPIRSLNDPEINGALDLVIDGADEIDSAGNLTKGGGGALLIEKIVAYNSEQVVMVVDESKLVDHLGLQFPIPVEVVPEARLTVTRSLERLGAVVQVRMAEKKMGPVVTDNGNILLDIRFEAAIDPEALEIEMNRIPGVMENGLFTRCNPLVYVGRSNGTVDVQRY